MIALDSSVMVAALRSTDERHQVALRSVQRALEEPEGSVLPAHSLVETFSVITRMPRPHRMNPADAMVLLRKTFGSSKLAPFTARSLWPLLDELAGADLGGGLIYDAMILKSSEDAGATALLTLNPRDFLRLSPRIEIRTP